jgi:DNA-binding SARP family transcriptional activator/transposase
MGHSYRTRIKSVKDYLRGGTLGEVASKYNVHRVTLSRWLKWYKEEYKKESKPYNRPWNRTSKEVEEMVAFLKENNPSLTARKAKEILKKKGSYLSKSSIINIWERYNIYKRPVECTFSSLGKSNPESKCAVEYAMSLLKDKRDENTLRDVGKILSDLPSYPFEHKYFLKEIPEKYLSLRRKLDRLNAIFQEIPKPRYLKKIRKIRKKLENKGYLYSSIIAGISEMLALEWMRAPKQELKLYSILEKRKGSLRDPGLNFALTFFAATAHAELLQMKKAKECSKKCRALLRSVPHLLFFELYGFLMTYIGDFKSALQFHKKTLEKVSNKDERKGLSLRIAHNYVEGGNYKEALKIIDGLRIRAEEKVYLFFYNLVSAHLNIGLGKFDNSLSFIQKVLEKAESHQFHNYLYASTLCLASMARALGRKKEAKRALKKYLPLFDKYNANKEALILRFLLEEQREEKSPVGYPHFQVLFLLKKTYESGNIKYYKKALKVAERKGISGFFHRVIVFFPEVISMVIGEGMDPELPQTILNFPVFDKAKPVYRINFLGELIVYQRDEKLKVGISHKDAAFLIHLALKAPEPDLSISLRKIYNNFWKDSKNPSRNLSHLLVRLKNQLHIPSRFLKVSSRGEYPSLINRGIHFTTDYNEYRNLLSQARALNRAKEWKFARREHRNALSLFRGKPFEKMYDNWSEDKRSQIIFSFQDEVLSYVKELKSRGEQEEVERLLRRAEKIVPFSDIIEEL